MTGRSALVIAASNRAAAGIYADRTGPVIVAWLRARGFEAPEPVVVPDGEPVAVALRDAVAAGVQVVITTGGTGISPTDRTPEATRSVLDYEVPGLADAVRAAGLPQVPTAMLSRGVAGVANRTLVVNLPGSTGGVRDGLDVLAGVLAHAVDQLAGGDHPAPGAPLAADPPDSGHPHDHDIETGGAPDEPHHDHHVVIETGAPDVAPDVAEGVAEAGDGAERPGDGTALVLRATVTEAPISVDEHAALVAHRAAGAVVTFAGVVRDHDGGRDVRELEYVGHPSAAEVVAEVAAELAARGDRVRAVAVSHRVGPLAIGDVALAVAVAAEHRRAAFELCSDLVDEVKRRLPVWKRQTFADGSEEWVNCP